MMANDSAVTSVWAKYGIAQSRPEYALLRRVTHWSAADVEKEKQTKPEYVEPKHILDQCFGQILECLNLD